MSAPERTFWVRQDVTTWGTITWRVTAESFEDAVDKVNNGYAEHYDQDDYDSDYGDIGSIECGVCGDEGDEGDECDCDKNEGKRESESFLAEIGL